MLIVDGPWLNVGCSLVIADGRWDICATFVSGGVPGAEVRRRRVVGVDGGGVRFGKVRWERLWFHMFRGKLFEHILLPISVVTLRPQIACTHSRVKLPMVGLTQRRNLIDNTLY
jgi:hypothetical protein